MRTTRVMAPSLIAMAVLCSACAGANLGGGSGGPPDAPPPVTIHYDGDSAELEPWTYCYGNGCADGTPPEDPIDVGSPEEVIVEYPLDDWNFKASFSPAGEPCGRTQTAALEETEDGDFVAVPLGLAGTYDVTLTGRGDGDLFVTFRWTTPFHGPLPKPKAYIGVLSDHDGEVDSYGVELSISNMAETPERARATITVTSSEGRSITFDATKRRKRCVAEGSLYWRGPTDKGLAAAKLGSPPFEYEVVLRLDGKRHKARATWPDDQIPWLKPYVWLRFRPKLPALKP